MNTKPDIIPLANIEAEQILLGSILRRNEFVDLIGGILEAKHFFEPIHAKLYDNIVATVRAGRVASAVMLKTFLDQDKSLQDVGGSNYPARLMAVGTSADKLSDLGNLIRDLWIRRQALELTAQASAQIQDLSPEITGAQYTAEFSHRLNALAATGDASKTRHSIGEALTQAIDSAADAYQNDGQRKDAIPTGLKALDDIIGGWVAGNLVVIGARPAMGKTAAALVFAHNATNLGHPCDFYSIEMKAASLGIRLLSLATMPQKIPYQRIKWGKIDEPEFQTIVDVARALVNYPLTIVDKPRITVAGIRAEIATTKITYPNLRLVIIDYLGLIENVGRSRGNRSEDVGEITKELKRIAGQYEVCILLLHQLSREVEKRENKRPQLSDLRESGSVEQDSDIVLFPHREEYYVGRDEPRPNTPEHQAWEDKMNSISGQMEIIVAKNREGRTGTAKLIADLSVNWIADRPDEQISMELR